MTIRTNLWRSIIATPTLDRLLHHSTTINSRGESDQLKDRRRAGLVLSREQEGQGSAPLCRTILGRDISIGGMGNIQSAMTDAQGHRPDCQTVAQLVLPLPGAAPTQTAHQNLRPRG